MQEWLEQKIKNETGQDLKLSELEKQWKNMWGPDNGNQDSSLPDFNLEHMFENIDKLRQGELPTLWNRMWSMLWWTGWIVLLIWTWLFNFLTSNVMFITTLYYLLNMPANNGDGARYGGSAIGSLLLRGGRNVVGRFLQDAVHKIVITHMRLAVFHVLWTWLTLRLLGSQLGNQSVVLSLLLIPVMRMELACLLGCTELWFLEDRPLGPAPRGERCGGSIDHAGPPRGAPSFPRY